MVRRLGRGRVPKRHFRCSQLIRSLRKEENLMTVRAGSLDGRESNDEKSTAWLGEFAEQVEKFCGASAHEAMTIADGIRRISGERLEQAFQAVRVKLGGRDRLEGEPDDGFILREKVRTLHLTNTLETWSQHTISPPEIRL